MYFGGNKKENAYNRFVCFQVVRCYGSMYSDVANNKIADVKDIFYRIS
jgi:hypothetical protein